MVFPRRIFCPIVFIVGLTLLAAPALAQDAKAEAKRLNALATKAFNVGLFAEAAGYYKRAYNAKPLPVFLYNLGQCHKRLSGLKHKKRALFFFKSYLSNATSPPDRSEVEGDIRLLNTKIKELEARKAGRRLAAVTPPADSPPPSSSRPLYKKWWLWTLIGVAVSGAAVGVAAAATPADVRPHDGSLGNLQLQLQLGRGGR